MRSSLTSSVLCVGVLFAFGIAATSVRAAEPAVREMNVRVIGSFDFLHVDSEDVNNFAGPTPQLIHLGEEDNDIGSVVGVITIPVAPSIGARGFLGAVGSKRHVDNAEERIIGGLEMGGDIFWRDPEVGEIGIGPRYSWTDVEVAGSNQSNHSGGATLTASLFVQDFGVGPIDLDFVGAFLDAEVDPDRDGSLSPGRSYSAAGGATLYLSDNVSLGLGGRWTRENAGNGERLIIRSADFDFELLLPIKPTVTLGAAISVGDQDVSIANFSNYGTSFFSLGISVGVSFPGGDSLVELNRYVY